MLTGFIRDTVRVYGCSIGALIIGIACWVILCYNSNAIGIIGSLSLKHQGTEEVWV